MATVSRITAEDAIYMDCSLTYYDDATISGATRTDPVVISSPGHGYSDGDDIYISEVTGMLQLNGRTFTVGGAATDAFELYDAYGNSIDGTAFGTYASGGVCEKWTDTIIGLAHLEGETVVVSSEGAVLPPVVVSSGRIELQYAVKKAHVGLGFNSYLQTMDLEAGSQIGTAQGKRKKIHQLTVRLYQTIGMLIGTDGDDLEIVPFRNSSMNTNESPDLFTGDKRVAFPRGFDRKQTIMIASEQPLPISIVAIMPYLQTTDTA